MTTIHDIRKQIADYIDSREKLNNGTGFFGYIRKCVRNIGFSEKQLEIHRELLGNIDRIIANPNQDQTIHRSNLRKVFNHAFERSCQLFRGQKKQITQDPVSGKKLNQPMYMIDTNSSVTHESLWYKNGYAGVQTSIGNIGFMGSLNFNHTTSFLHSVENMGIGTPGHHLLFQSRMNLEKCFAPVADSKLERRK